MRVIWRILLLALLHAGVLILFPYYTPGAPLLVLISFIVLCALCILLSVIFSILWLSRSFIFRTLFDVLLVAAVAVLLLSITPQYDGVSPADKLLRGQYPTAEEAQIGWNNFKHLWKGGYIRRDIKPAAEEIEKGVKKINNKIKTKDFKHILNGAPNAEARSKK